jgi:hypothetical protein
MIQRHGQVFAVLFASLILACPSFAEDQPLDTGVDWFAPQQQPAGNAPAPQSPQTQAPGAQTPDNTQQDQQEQKTGTSNDRIFWAMPNFLTVKGATIPPLTAKQKFSVVARSAFDYFEYPWYGLLAGISQAENSDAGYGQGMEGYAQRYGAAFADGTIENFMVGAVLPSALHQDPRYYEMGKGGFWHRTEYAVSRLFITRSDSGHAEFNFSEIVGSAISASISSFTYHPRGERNIGNAATVWGTEIGYDGITIEVKEFWPDIHRKFTKKKQN